MAGCIYCNREEISSTLEVCVDCVREGKISPINELHKEVRKEYSLPEIPPDKGIVKCNLCSNRCKMDNGQRGYCGLRENIDGKLVSKVNSQKALVHPLS